MALVATIDFMEDSIFTRIIKGQIPAHRVYEDKNVIGILDIHPIQPGHTLIIPRKQIDHFTDMKEGDFKDLMNAAHKVAKHIKNTLGTERIVLRIEGFDVAHVHVHLVPVNQEHESYREGRLTEEPDHDSLRAMAKKLYIAED